MAHQAQGRWQGGLIALAVVISLLGLAEAWVYIE